jgi:hypothetical protein
LPFQNPPILHESFANFLRYSCPLHVPMRFQR